MPESILNKSNNARSLTFHRSTDFSKQKTVFSERLKKLKYAGEDSAKSTSLVNKKHQQLLEPGKRPLTDIDQKINECAKRLKIAGDQTNVTRSALQQISPRLSGGA